MDKIKRIANDVWAKYSELDRKYQAIIGIVVLVVVIFIIT